MTQIASLPKRLLVGRPLRSDRLDDTLLPKRLALPVFCSDPLSSNAYATQEILLMLSLGGVALLHLTVPVAAAVVVLLVVVVVSYRQTCHAYPGGGGAYAVSRANLGQRAALVAAAALLVDYVLTVAVSIASGVSNVVSAFPALAPHAVAVSVGLVAVMTLANLRGVRESGAAFAVPTYGFVVAVFAMIAVGLVRTVAGAAPVAESAHLSIAPAGEHVGVLALVAIGLRAFASGCTALTGVEAVSNGVPNFRPPKSRNAASTLGIMAALTVTMFVGLTALALISHVHVADEVARLVGAPEGYQQRTVIAQIAGAVFGANSVGFYLVQAFTALILVLAANTAFNGFPVLASILGQDGYLPRQMSRRGDRLVFSNGILILASAAVVLLVAFRADPNRLIQPVHPRGVRLVHAEPGGHGAALVRRAAHRPACGPRPHPTRARHQRRRCAAHRGRARGRGQHQVHARRLPGGHRDAGALRRDAGRAQALHARRRRGHARPRGGSAAQPRARRRARLEGQPAGPARPGVRPGDPPSSLRALTVRTNPEESDRLVAEWTGRDVPVP
ncbi:APC family permease [Cellulomonas soli]